MLILIHGDNVEASRNKLVELKEAEKDKEIRELDGRKLDATTLAQTLSSSSMFGGGVLVVIEQYGFDKTLSSIIEASQTINVLLYTTKEVSKTNIAKLGTSAKVFFFKTPVVIFQFLDSLTLPLLQTVLTTEPAEVIFALLVRRVRQLIQIKDNVIPDGMQGWQAARLTNQAKHFTMDELIAMHRKLLDIDIAIKTGNTPYTLSELLEQFVILL